MNIFFFGRNIDCIFLHNNFIKNINYLPKTVNQTIFCFHIYSTSPGHCVVCKGAPQKVNEWWKNFQLPYNHFLTPGGTPPSSRSKGASSSIYPGESHMTSCLPMQFFFQKRGLRAQVFAELWGGLCCHLFTYK